MAVPETVLGSEDATGSAAAVGTSRTYVARHVEGVERVVAREITDLTKSSGGERDLKETQFSSLM